MGKASSPKRSALQPAPTYPLFHSPKALGRNFNPNPFNSDPPVISFQHSPAVTAAPHLPHKPPPDTQTAAPPLRLRGLARPAAPLPQPRPPPPPASKTGKVRAGPGQAPTGNAPQRGAAERCRVPTAGPRRAAPPPTLTPQLPLWRQPRARREPPQPFSPAFPAPPHTARPRPDARRENESGWRRRPALSWECGTTNPDVPRGAARGGSFEWGKESAQRCARGPCLGALWDCGGAPRGSFPSPASRRASKSTGWAL